MAVATQNIERKRGDTFPIKFQIKDTAGAVVDITGYTGFELTVDPVRAPDNDTGKLFTLTGTITDGSNGRVEFTFTVAEEEDQTPGVYHYDAQFTDLSSNVRTFVEGTYTVVQDINK